MKTSGKSNLLGATVVKLFCFEQGVGQYQIKPAIRLTNPSPNDIKKAQQSLANLVNNVAFRVINGSKNIETKMAFAEKEMKRISNFNVQLEKELKLIDTKQFSPIQPGYNEISPRDEKYFKKLISLKKQVESNNTTIRIFQKAKVFNTRDKKQTLSQLNRSMETMLKKGFDYAMWSIASMDGYLGFGELTQRKMMGLEVNQRIPEAIVLLREFSSILEGQNKADLDTKISGLNDFFNTMVKRK